MCPVPQWQDPASVHRLKNWFGRTYGMLIVFFQLKNSRFYCSAIYNTYIISHFNHSFWVLTSSLYWTKTTWQEEWCIFWVLVLCCTKTYKNFFSKKLRFCHRSVHSASRPPAMPMKYTTPHTSTNQVNKPIKERTWLETHIASFLDICHINYTTHWITNECIMQYINKKQTAGNEQ